MTIRSKPATNAYRDGWERTFGATTETGTGPYRRGGTVATTSETFQACEGSVPVNAEASFTNGRY